MSDGRKRIDAVMLSGALKAALDRLAESPDGAREYPALQAVLNRAASVAAKVKSGSEQPAGQDVPERGLQLLTGTSDPLRWKAQRRDLLVGGADAGYEKSQRSEPDAHAERYGVALAGFEARVAMILQLALEIFDDMEGQSNATLEIGRVDIRYSSSLWRRFKRKLTSRYTRRRRATAVMLRTRERFVAAATIGIKDAHTRLYGDIVRVAGVCSEVRLDRVLRQIGELYKVLIAFFHKAMSLDINGGLTGIAAYSHDIAGQYRTTLAVLCSAGDKKGPHVLISHCSGSHVVDISRASVLDQYSVLLGAEREAEGPAEQTIDSIYDVFRQTGSVGDSSVYVVDPLAEAARSGVVDCFAETNSRPTRFSDENKINARKWRNDWGFVEEPCTRVSDDGESDVDCDGEDDCHNGRRPVLH